MQQKCLILIIFGAMIAMVNGANILAIFPNPRASHVVLGQALLYKLSQKGHNVTMVSSLDLQLENLHNIKINALTSIYQHFLVQRTFYKVYDMWNELKMTLQLTERIFFDLTQLGFFKNRNQFDLVIVENYMNEAHLVFGHQFGVPTIGFSASGVSATTLHTTANSNLVDMNDCAVERLKNFLSHLIFTAMHQVFFYKKHNDLIQKYFPGAPSLKVLVANVSLTLYNSHPSLEYPHALMPNSIEIGGFYMKNEANLPTDLQQLMDSASDGVIYFSLGMDVRKKDINLHLKEILVSAFGKLGHTVLWRWNEKFIPGQTKNLVLRPWWPQNDILAHPATKLFITNGGSLSFSEAIYHEVPILVLPIFNDHSKTVEQVEKFIIGLTMNIDNVTEQNLLEAITTILTNPKYKENIKKRSYLLKNQIIAPDDKAVYWIEYVIENGGAPILRPPSLDFPWYRVWMVDIIGLICFSCIVCINFFVVVKRMIHWQFCTKEKNVDVDDDKNIE